MMTKEQLLAEAKKLGPADLEELIEDLNQVIEPGELTKAQHQELVRRVEEIERGEVEMIDADVAIARLRARARR